MCQFPQLQVADIDNSYSALIGTGSNQWGASITEFFILAKSRSQQPVHRTTSVSDPEKSRYENTINSVRNAAPLFLASRTELFTSALQWCFKHKFSVELTLDTWYVYSKRTKTKRAPIYRRVFGFPSERLNANSSMNIAFKCYVYIETCKIMRTNQARHGFELQKTGLFPEQRQWNN